MPSWKKVITSGSNAAFNSLTVSNTITGSISGSLTGSLFGTASWADSASRATTSSYALTAAVFPFAGNAVITGSLVVTGSTTSTQGFTGSLLGTSSWATVAVRPLVGVSTLLPGSDGLADSTYYTLVIRDTLPGTNSHTILAATASLKYSGSLDLLYTTASWAKESLTASYALSSPSVTPQGNTNEIQYNVDGTNFGGVPALTYDGTNLIGTGSFTGSFTGSVAGNLRLGLFRGTFTEIPIITSKGDEVLVYSQYIPSGTFADGDVIRVHYKIQNNTNDGAKFRIYLDDQSDFTTVSGSLTKLIVEASITQSAKYVGIKRDLITDPENDRLVFMNSGSSVINQVTDDVVSNDPVSTFAMDWATTNYWMFFSALPGQIGHSSKALGFTIERV